MKTTVSILAVLLLASCGMSKDQMIRKQIQSKKTQIAKLEKKITELESQLTDTLDSDNSVIVTLKEVQPESFSHYITVFGNVEAEQYARVSPEMNGQIRKIHVQEGQHCSKGALLVSLNSDATESTIDEVKTNLELAQTNYSKIKELWDQGIGSEMQYLQAKSQKESAEARLETLEAQLRMSQVRAPFDGIVDKIYLKEGDLAGPMTPLVEFVNLSKITIRADVSETFVGSIHAGDQVEVRFSTLPDLVLNEQIERTSKVIDPESRTFEIELNFSNPGEKIRPNMVSSILINDFSSGDALVVPSIVVKRDITGDYLYVASEKEGKMKATKRYVERGITYEGFTMINKGLKAGDRVVVQGYNLVSTGSTLAEK